MSMKIIISGILFVFSTFSYAADCSFVVRDFITAQYPYQNVIERMTMSIKRLGMANVGSRFEDTRLVSEIDVYSVGTSDESGGLLYLITLHARSCQVISVNKIMEQSD